MKTPYVRDLEPNQLVHGIFLVQHKEVRQKKSGEPYLSLTLGDRTGELDAKMWDNAQDSLDTFEREDFVRVKGLLQIFQSRRQLTIHKIQPVPESEIDVADYFPASSRDREEMFAELRSWIGSMTNPHLKALLESIFADESIALAYRTAPAAKSVHHAWLGGLIEHVLSLCHLAKFTAAHYHNIDFDLLLSGVLLHDIGKISELSYARGFSYTTPGQLLGHITIGVSMVQDKLRTLPGFPPALRDMLLHMILSHHGELAFGSPKVPLFPEAMLLHQLDNMDSKMECMRALLEKDGRFTGVWTGYSAPLERNLLNKAKYLAADEGPLVESKAADPGSRPASQTSPQPASSQSSLQPGAQTPPAKSKPVSSDRPATDSVLASKLQDALRRDG
jgi:3'-5' exoribonuclease